MERSRLRHRQCQCLKADSEKCVDGQCHRRALCCKKRQLHPCRAAGMPFASFKEAFEEILSQAERGNAFCCYMIGNVYYWGDYLLVEPELAKQFKTENKYYAWAYPIAKEWYERSFNGRICAGWATTARSASRDCATSKKMSLKLITKPRRDFPGDLQQLRTLSRA